MEGNLLIYVILLGVAVVVASQTVLISMGGTRAMNQKALRSRLEQIAREHDSHVSVIRQQYLDSLNPMERWIESSAFGEWLGQRLDMAGVHQKSYLVAIGLVFAATMIGLVSFFFFQVPIASLLLFGVTFMAFHIWLIKRTTKRLNLFDEQFIEALDVMKRALLVGYPLSEVTKTVSEELDAPVGDEFARLHTELNYGVELRTALSGFAERNPTVAVLAFISAVIIQKESGGNLAENLDKLTAVIRGRFKLFRKVKTLSAEGRLSAWILMLVPLVLFLVLYFTTPDYLQPLFTETSGQKLVMYAAISSLIGLLWIRKILRIEV